jgi:eukaryotic-like serine/threonine-protein kinase
VRAFLLLLSIAVLVSVIAVGAWLVLGDTPDEVAVPDLVGKNFDEAINELKARGFAFSSETVPGPDTAVNTVIRMSPEPGDMVKPGRSITLYIVASKPMLTVPNLVGGYFIEAENILRRAGLEMQTEGLRLGRIDRLNSDSPAGMILAQSPEAGTETYAGGRVDIVIAANKESSVMPNLVNLTLDAVRDTLARLGYDINSVAEPYFTTSWPANVIRSQVPAPGTKLAPNVVIRVIYARPPDAPNAYPEGAPADGGDPSAHAPLEPARAPEPLPEASPARRNILSQPGTVVPTQPSAEE